LQTEKINGGINMAAVTAQMVKELRELSGVGMMDCKKALAEADGNIERAQEILREKGLNAAGKKAGRIAAEGLVDTLITDDKKIGVIVEVNSETDFVAKNPDFQAFVKQVANQVIVSGAKDAEGLLTTKWHLDESLTVAEALSHKIAVIGENLIIRRFERLDASGNSYFSSYIHAGGKVGVLLELTSTGATDALEEAGKNICMQIAAMSPTFVNRLEVSQEYLDKEKEIFTQQALNEGKPANIVEKMITGRIEKSLKEVCLEDQIYVKDDAGKQNVAAYLKTVGPDVSVKRFVRFATGEGIEKKQENFADEVNKAMQ